ncbi:MAG: hypothetical protein KDK76_01160 [Chlamydiia bacterium]|nr:hypothetical protein [Chlamydiia bacterium]
MPRIDSYSPSSSEIGLFCLTIGSGAVALKKGAVFLAPHLKKGALSTIHFLARDGGISIPVSAGFLTGSSLTLIRRCKKHLGERICKKSDSDKTLLILTAADLIFPFLATSFFIRGMTRQLSSHVISIKGAISCGTLGSALTFLKLASENSDLRMALSRAAEQTAEKVKALITGNHSNESIEDKRARFWKQEKEGLGAEWILYAAIENTPPEKLAQMIENKEPIDLLNRVYGIANEAVLVLAAIYEALPEEFQTRENREKLNPGIQASLSPLRTPLTAQQKEEFWSRKSKLVSDELHLSSGASELSLNAIVELIEDYPNPSSLINRLEKDGRDSEECAEIFKKLPLKKKTKEAQNQLNKSIEYYVKPFSIDDNSNAYPIYTKYIEEMGSWKAAVIDGAQVGTALGTLSSITLLVIKVLLAFDYAFPAVKGVFPTAYALLAYAPVRIIAEIIPSDLNESQKKRISLTIALVVGIISTPFLSSKVFRFEKRVTFFTGAGFSLLGALSTMFVFHNEQILRRLWEEQSRRPNHYPDWDDYNYNPNDFLD